MMSTKTSFIRLLILKILTPGTCSFAYSKHHYKCRIFKRFVYLAPLRDPWKGLVEIFQMETWLLLGFTLFIAGVSWFIFGKVMSPIYIVLYVIFI